MLSADDGRIADAMDENAKLAIRLSRIYARLLGERERLIAPPKYLTRLIPEMEAYEAAQPERQARIAEIEDALPHLAYVVQVLDPTCDLSGVKPVRPKMPNRVDMPNGISGTAMDIVREIDEPLAVCEIVDIMGERFGLDLSSVRERQRYYDAINQAFAGTFRDDLIEHSGHLPENPSWRRRWSWKHRVRDDGV